jgi:hypothetical protein
MTVASRLLASENYPDLHVVFFAPCSDDRGGTTDRGFYVVARRRALAGPFKTASEAESTCIALGGRR